MNKEIIKLVGIALEDGILTEKERQIILRKAANLGLDVDEVEMYLENCLGKLNQVQEKEQEVAGRAENLNKIFELEKRQKERKIEENKLIKNENEELKEILEVKLPGSLELREWWNNLFKDEKKNLRQAIDASTNLLGRFNPDEDQLMEMYYLEANENNQKEHGKRKKEIDKDRKKRRNEEAELFEIEQAEINKLRSSLTKTELKKIDKSNGVLGKIKSFFKT